MKLDALSTGLLLSPAAAYAIQLPFDASSLRNKLSETLARFEIPAFIKNIADPIAASPLLSLHRSLVEIPSVTGSERTVADWLAKYLTSKNFTVETQAVGGYNGDRVNVFAYLGKNRTTRTLVTSHIDTVPPFIPYKISGNHIYGRGSNDAKGSVAAQITAVEELVAADVVHEGDISLLYVVGEEKLGDGMESVNSLGLSWKAVIFGEPTENKLAIGHKGIMLFNVIAKGKACHSGYPQLGVNANSQLIKALAILDNLRLPSSPTLGNSTLNIGKITGGVAPNVVPAEAIAELSVRVAGDLDETTRVLKESMEGLEAELQFTEVGYGPQELDHEIEGFEKVVCSYGTDVPHLRGDHKKFLYGPGSIHTAHSDGEFVLKSDLVEAVNGYKKLIRESLWPTKPVPAIVKPEAQSSSAATTSSSSSTSAVTSSATIVSSSIEPSDTGSASEEL